MCTPPPSLSHPFTLCLTPPPSLPYPSPTLLLGPVLRCHHCGFRSSGLQTYVCQHGQRYITRQWNTGMPRPQSLGWLGYFWCPCSICEDGHILRPLAGCTYLSCHGNSFESPSAPHPHPHTSTHPHIYTPTYSQPHPHRCIPVLQLWGTALLQAQLTDQVLLTSHKVQE